MEKLLVLLLLTGLCSPTSSFWLTDLVGEAIDGFVEGVFEGLADDDDDDDSSDWLFDLLEDDDPCDPNPCQRNATCTPDNGDFNCSCPEPYTGTTCEKMKIVCKNAKCGHGVCVVKEGPPYYECACKAPYQPPKCQEPSACDPSPCLNGGSCIKGDSPSSFQCLCILGFTGRFCEISPNDCYEDTGESYRGNVSETEEGSECLPWNAFFIIFKGFNPLTDFGEKAGLGPHNYCRNPDGDARPWCFVRDNKKLKWELCDVKRCPAGGTVTETPAVTETDEATEAPQEDFATCGIPDPNRVTPRIHGGMKATPGSYPWQVSLTGRTKGTKEKFSHFCGGILLRSCWVLTAAHCIDKDTDMRVVLGALNIERKEPFTQTIDVAEAVVHENYRATNDALYNDIALLRLQITGDGRCANETMYVKTACLPDGPFPNGTQCTISGWGATEKAYFSSRLLYATVVLLSQQRCMAPNVYGDLLDDSMLCAGNMKGGVDSCQGDSGGPLTCVKDDRHVVYGVVSWGDSCAVKNKPGIYARVTTFVDWINSKISAS